MSYPFVRQYDAMDCGPACLTMVARWHGKHFSLQSVREMSYITREGSSFLGLKQAAENLGFKAIGVRIPFEDLALRAPLPCIAHWKQNHFIVIYRIEKNRIWIADPAIGRLKMNRQQFLSGWSSGDADSSESGMALFLEPASGFEERPDDPVPVSGFTFLRSYLKPFKNQIAVILLTLFAAGAINLAFPFLTQYIIDRGVRNNDLGIIYLILLGQLALTMGRLLIDFFRGWIMLHLGSKLNIRIISDFLKKLMALPVAYFDTKLNGDILQRIDDNNRIENFLSSSSLNIIFSLFTFIVFGIYLGVKSLPVLLLFCAGTALYILFVSLFMPSRVVLDNIRFRQMAVAGDKMINIVNGMQEIKLAGTESGNRKEWEELQQEIHETRVKGLRISQYQAAGGTLIHEATNILITVISAASVINAKMSLGEMLAIQFIAGQLNGPVSQIINFLKSSQETRLSLERLAEIHGMKPEGSEESHTHDRMPDDKTIALEDISFRYEGPGSPMVLNAMNLRILNGTTTAIVGESGSGKSTLLKMILGFYKPVTGSITIGNIPLEKISIPGLRRSFGVVMQEGYIFPDTILANIAPGEENPDAARLKSAIEASDLQTVLDTLPSGLLTMVGAGGRGLSQGQKQKILIARVVYKQPSVVILDEATSALDASGERVITDRLAEFFAGRTVIIVAHRLSTVRNADLIVVLEKGQVREMGKHNELVALKGSYFRLVKDQLELGQ